MNPFPSPRGKAPRLLDDSPAKFTQRGVDCLDNSIEMRFWAAGPFADGASAPGALLLRTSVPGCSLKVPNRPEESLQERCYVAPYGYKRSLGVVAE
jgi:hypothetical protein